MSIIRSPRLAQDFTILSNAVVRDARLSYRASGVLAEILSRPDNWRTDATTMARSRPEGRDAIRKALGELEALGYIIRGKARDDLGRWVSTMIVFDSPRGYNRRSEPGRISRRRRTRRRGIRSYKKYRHQGLSRSCSG